MLKKHLLLFSTNTSVRLFPIPRPKKPVYQGNLTNSKDLNNQTLWDNRPIYVDVFKQYSLIHPYFQSSLKVLKK